MKRTALSPLGAVVRGLAAGAAGTGVMTAWQEYAARWSDPGGPEPAEADPWETAPVPAKVAKRILEGVFGRDVPASRIPLLTNAMHWSYGIAWGSVFGLLQGTSRRRPLAHGVLFGAGVWAASYAELVPMGLYEPPWSYPPKTLALDLSYHLAYGIGVGAAFAASTDNFHPRSVGPGGPASAGPRTSLRCRSWRPPGVSR